MLCRGHNHCRQVFNLKFYRRAALETIQYQDGLGVEMVQINALVMYLFDLLKKHLGNCANLLLGEGAPNICEHVQVASSLPLILRLNVIYVVLPPVEILIQATRWGLDLL